ncbi:MAG: LPXTG cell wall anchor domain-containing protein [Dehalococcoidia bacterium]|nr:LPXTG cell wall anchor domain-containing protein [Dehalococcoidia bacterium]
MTVNVTLNDLYFDPPNLAATAGGTIIFNMRNAGNLPHNIHIGGQGMDVQSQTLQAGQTGTWSVTLPSMGVYAIYCAVGLGTPNLHRIRGMDGTINVGAAADPAAMQTRRMAMTTIGGSGVGGTAIIQPRADGATHVQVNAMGLIPGAGYFSGTYTAASSNCSGGLLPPFAVPVAANAQGMATINYVGSAPASQIVSVSVRAGAPPANPQQVRACADPRIAVAPAAPAALPRTGDDATPLMALLSALAMAALGAGVALRKVSAQ